jgi:nitroreductase
MIELLRRRRSIRRYEDRPIEREKIEVLMEAVLRSPSSRGLAPWSFIFVEDNELLRRLSFSKSRGSEFLKDAALGVAVCADETVSDCWVEDASIASIILQLCAQALGLGTCWIQVRGRPHSSEKSAEAYVKEVLQIPEALRVLCIISIGYPAERKDPTPKEALHYGRIHHNVYGSAWSS